MYASTASGSLGTKTNVGTSLVGGIASAKNIEVSSRRPSQYWPMSSGWCSKGEPASATLLTS
jgi:hypothetical protein